jgi:hypothetical protein
MEPHKSQPGDTGISRLSEIVVRHTHSFHFPVCFSAKIWTLSQEEEGEDFWMRTKYEVKEIKGSRVNI